MSNPDSSAAPPGDPVTLAEVVRLLRAGRRRVIAWTAVFAVSALSIALFATPRYQAQTLLAPPDQGINGGALGALAGQFGGLADLAGVDLGGKQDIDQTLVILQSREFLERFAASEHVAQVLFADRWEAGGQRWRADRSAFAGVRATLAGWLASLSGDRGASSRGADDGAPDPWLVYRKLAPLIDVQKDKRTQIVTLGVRWKDPQVAAGWANALVRHLNEEARSRALRESAHSLAYLQGQLARTDVVELRQALYRLIESEQKRAMAINVHEEFAVRVLARAQPPRERVFPRRTALVLGGTLTGLIAGMFWTLASGVLFRPGGRRPA